MARPVKRSPNPLLGVVMNAAPNTWYHLVTNNPQESIMLLRRAAIQQGWIVKREVHSIEALLWMNGSECLEPRGTTMCIVRYLFREKKRK